MGDDEIIMLKSTFDDFLINLSSSVNQRIHLLAKGLMPSFDLIVLTSPRSQLCQNCHRPLRFKEFGQVHTQDLRSSRPQR